MSDVAMTLARTGGREVDRAFVEREIARLARALEMPLAEARSPRDQILALRTLLFEKEGFESARDLSSRELLDIDSVLKKKRGYCLSLSTVALLVAERAGLPLTGVAAPNHFFVRLDSGDARFNLELTRNGELISDADYILRMGDFYHEGQSYLKSLPAGGVCAALLHNYAFLEMKAGRHDAALSLLDAARLRMAPLELPEIARTRGICLGEKGDHAGAVWEFTNALRQYPGDVDAMFNRAVSLYLLGRDDEGAADLAVVLAIDPGHARAKDLLKHGAPFTARKQQFSGSVLPLGAPPAELKPGLAASFYKEKEFRQLLASTIVHDLDFDWGNGPPAKAVPADGFGSRFEGWLKITESASYTVFVVANDGVRVVVGDNTMIDHWKAMGYENYYGSADLVLSAGWHRIRVEQFDERGGARLILKIGAAGAPATLPLRDHLFHATGRPGK